MSDNILEHPARIADFVSYLNDIETRVKGGLRDGIWPHQISILGSKLKVLKIPITMAPLIQSFLEGKKIFTDVSFEEADGEITAINFRCTVNGYGKEHELDSGTVRVSLDSPQSGE